MSAIVLSTYLGTIDLSLNSSNKMETPFDKVIAKIPRGIFFDILNSQLEKLVQTYTKDEINDIYVDFEIIQQNIFQGVPRSRMWSFAVSMPGANVRANFKHFLQKTHQKYAYISCRDCLLNMERTYKKDLQIKTKSEAVGRWKVAANFVANVFFEKAVNEKYNIAGSTKEVISQIERIHKDYYYNTRALHLSCGEIAIKKDETKYREVREKFFKSLSEIVPHCDLIHFCYDDGKRTVLTLEQLETSGFILTSLGNLEKLELIKQMHDEACGKGFWEKYVQTDFKL